MRTIEMLLSSLWADASVRQVLVGAFWTTVVLNTDPPSCGLASTLRAATHDEGPPVSRAGRLLEHSGRELAGWLGSANALEASIGMAALNALLEVNEAACAEVNAGEVIVDRGKGQRVAMDAVSGTRMTDPRRVLQAVGQGATFRQIKRAGGLRLLTMTRVTMEGGEDNASI